jgi:hypothetical protein
MSLLLLHGPVRSAQHSNSDSATRAEADVSGAAGNTSENPLRKPEAKKKRKRKRKRTEEQRKRKSKTTKRWIGALLPVPPFLFEVPFVSVICLSCSCKLPAAFLPPAA